MNGSPERNSSSYFIRRSTLHCIGAPTLFDANCSNRWRNPPERADLDTSMRVVEKLLSPKIKVIKSLLTIMDKLTNELSLEISFFKTSSPANCAYLISPKRKKNIRISAGKITRKNILNYYSFFSEFLEGKLITALLI